MSEKVTLTVELQDSESRPVTVQEVFTHVLELFELVEDGSGIRWRFLSASTNSPLQITAEAFPSVSTMPPPMMAEAARRQVKQFTTNLRTLEDGRLPDEWRSGKKQQTVKRVLLRNATLVRRTSVRLTDPESSVSPVIGELTSPTATVLVKRIEDGQLEALAPTRPHRQMGSVDGTLVRVDRYYNHPAIFVVDRLSGVEIPCVVTEEERDHIAKEATFNDVWSGARVTVQGAIDYNAQGVISRITASDVRLFSTPPPPEDEAVHLSDVTDGLDSVEYIDRLREGRLG